MITRCNWPFRPNITVCWICPFTSMWIYLDHPEPCGRQKSLILSILIQCLIRTCFSVWEVTRIDRSECNIIWTASSEFGTYRLCEQRRFRRACTSAQSRQNLRCSLIQAVNQEEPSDRKPDPWPLWMAGHAQLKFVMTECSKTQIRLTGLIWTNLGCMVVL